MDRGLKPASGFQVTGDRREEVVGFHNGEEL